MGRKKDEPLNLKIITPKQKEILKTRPKITLAQALYTKQKFEQYDPKKRIPEIADGFVDYLLETGLFKFQDGNFIFCSPKRGGSFPEKNSEPLLLNLCLELGKFFFVEDQKLIHYDAPFKLEQIAKNLISIKDFLVSAKVVKKNVIEANILTLIRWEKKAIKFIIRKIEPTKIEKELIPTLERTFREHASQRQLSDNAVDNSIAIILMKFGLVEGGKLETVVKRMKQDRMRMRSKKLVTK